MEILVYLIPAALGLGLLGLGAFLWAMRNGQFEDLDGAAHRALMDDDEPDGPAAASLRDALEHALDAVARSVPGSSPCCG